MVVSKAKTKTKSLSALFRRAMRNSGKASEDAAAAAASSNGSSLATVDEDLNLRDFVRSVNTPSISGPDSGETPLPDRISSIVCGKPAGGSRFWESIDEKSSLKCALETTSFPSGIPSSISSKWKDLSRERKSKYVFKNTQSQRLKRLLKGYAQKLGTETMFNVFGRLGQGTGIKEYNAMIELYIEHARRSNDLGYALDKIERAFGLFKEMRERGFPMEEGTYGPLLNYLIEMDMIEEFQVFSEIIRDGSTDSCPRLGYYEMLLWIQVNNEEKIQELCSTVNDSGEDLSSLQENYLIALCERDRKENLQKLLEIVDITKNSSLDLLTSIFEYLGRSLLDSVAEKFLRELKKSDEGVKIVSDLICSYTTSAANLSVEDAIFKFNNLHEELEVAPSTTSYEKLIKYSCDSHEVFIALDIVEQMCEAGLVVSSDILHYLLQAIEWMHEFNLVRKMYSIMCCSNVKPNGETFRSMMSLCVKMKDFEGAYNMLHNLKEFKLTPTSAMYNTILAGLFREKNVKGAWMVLKQMKEADVKLDSITFSYLINNCDREEDIAKYYEELKQENVQVTKHVFMALINAYASCGQSEKAKQVVLDKGVPVKNLNEVKSVLISALASNGQMRDALELYEEMKKAGCPVETKSIIALIEYFDSKGEFSTLVQLVDELHDHRDWIDGLCRVILFAIRNKRSSVVLDLLRQAKYPLSMDEVTMEYLFDEVFCLIAEVEPSDVKLGLELLGFIKEELGFLPSRKCLDFLLSACVNAKDKQSALFIWKEYQSAGLPYNVLSFVRMYQAMLASRDSKAARAILSKISKEDKHVRCLIQECRTAFPRKPKRKPSKTKKKISTD